MILALSTISLHSWSERSPVLSFCESTLEFMARIRLASCSFDISRENMAVVTFFLTVTYSAILRAKAVLPIDGLAAIRIRSEF